MADLEVIESDGVTAPTRRALLDRLRVPDGPRFFDAAAFATLEAVCARLIPEPPDRRPIGVALRFDAMLSDGTGDGWRYAVLPSDADTHRLGLSGIEETAAAMAGVAFVDLPPAARDDVLRAVQAGDPPGETWRSLPAKRYFEELLAALTELYYAHPSVIEEIGYRGFADAQGWQDIGLAASAAE